VPVPSPLRIASQRLITLLDEKSGVGASRRTWAVLATTWSGWTLLLFLLRPGYTFSPYGYLDSWIYAAYQWDLKHQIADFGPTYYGSRLSWILPGALFHSFLPLFAARVCFKLTVSALFAAACALTVHRTLGLGAAVLAVTLSVLSPQIIGALHTDYIDTAVIVYAALAVVCITVAKDSRRWPAWIFLGGCFFTGMVIANLSALASLGLGVAVFHLFWLRWGLRRFIASIGLYLAAALVTCAVLGLVHRAAGGEFLFLKPQIDMLTYMRNLKENPWIPKDPWWFTEATWLLLPVGAIGWGLYCSFVIPPPDDRKRLLVRSLTVALAVSFSLALILQLRALNATLSFSYYASFHLSLALPLLVVCLASSGRPAVNSGAWLLATLALIALITLAWDPQSVSHHLFEILPFLHSFRAVPLLLTIVLLLCAALTARMTRARSPSGILSAWSRPEWLFLGLFACSMSYEFRGIPMADRLKERYGAVHAAYRLLAHEFPMGSYRFWVHPEVPDGVSLASTKLWGYRLFSLKEFPEFETVNLAAITARQTLVVPSPPGRGPEVLLVAERALKAAQYDMSDRRVIPSPGEAGTGFDLVCFSIDRQPIDPEAVPAKSAPSEAAPADVLIDLNFAAARPYPLTLAHNLYGSKHGNDIDTAKGYPVFTRTDQRDHLATEFRPLRQAEANETRQVSVVAIMPAGGNCVGVVQVDDCQTIAQIAWSKPGRSVHTLPLPAGAKSLRLYLQAGDDAATPLPTHIMVYLLHPPASASERPPPTATPAR